MTLSELSTGAASLSQQLQPPKKTRNKIEISKMKGERKKIEAFRDLLWQRKAIAAPGAHLTPIFPATTPEGHTAWHTAAMAAAIRYVNTGDKNVLATRIGDLNTKEREIFIKTFTKGRKSHGKEKPIDTAERLWKETQAQYIQEARKAYSSRMAIEELANTYANGIIEKMAAAEVDWYARELNAQQAAYLKGDHDPDFALSTYEPEGKTVLERPYNQASPYNSGAAEARAAFEKEAAKALYTLDRMGAIVLGNGDFVGEVAPDWLFNRAARARDLFFDFVSIEKDGGDPVPIPRLAKAKEGNPWARTLFALYRILDETETGLALEAVDAEEGADTPAAHKAAQRAAEFDAAWDPICAKYGVTSKAAKGSGPESFALVRRMAWRDTRNIDTALVHREPMEHFYQRAEDYTGFLRDTRGELAKAATGADYNTADFLTMVNGLLSLLSKQSQAAGTLTTNGATGPQMKGWNIVAIKDGEKIRIASADPILTFTAAALIKEGRGGTPQKRDVERMQRLITDVANMNPEEAQAAGLYRALINRVGSADTIEQTDPATGVKTYYICLTRNFLGGARYFRVVDSWDAYLQAKRSAKGLEAKSNTYVTETDMRFLFYLRTLKPGEPNRISSEALAERIGKGGELSHNPARFHADIKAMAEAAKTMAPPLLSSYTYSAKKSEYSFTTIAQTQTALPDTTQLPAPPAPEG